MSEEQIFYDMNDVRVTSVQFIVGDRTYPLGNATSVELHHERAKKDSAFKLIIAGGFLLLAGVMLERIS